MKERDLLINLQSVYICVPSQLSTINKTKERKNSIKAKKTATTNK